MSKYNNHIMKICDIIEGYDECTKEMKDEIIKKYCDENKLDVNELVFEWKDGAWEVAVECVHKSEEERYES